MGNFGYLLQFLGLISSAIAVILFGSSMKKESETYDKYGTLFIHIQTILITLASIILMYALATGYFKIEYVAQYTDSKLPFVYKISGFWAGQAGSLLFWGWLIALCSSIEAFRIKKYGLKYKAGVFFALALTSGFFFVLTNFVTNPFKELDFFPADGLGMNPLLQNPGMLYHPPTLYLGFVLFTIAFAHAFSSLINNNNSSSWVVNTRGWSILSWVFLTIGIVLGGQWAYVELGWGGYWAWDPVENASLLPWLTGTAFLHSAIMYERKEKLKIWTYVLILLTYELCIFGTFLTRSGVIDSVHSFGKSALGPFFIFFILITGIGFIYYLIANIKNMKEETSYSVVSKEGMFYITNWLFTALMLVILFGTTLPILTQLFPSKLSVGIPYYNKVSTPFFMLIILISGLCPLLPYGNSKMADIIKNLWPSFIFMVVATTLIYVYGYTKPLPLVLFAFTSFSLFTILLQIFRGIKRNGIGIIYRNSRLYGALIIHFGLVVLSYGVIASSFYNVSVDKVVAPGETISFYKYELKVGDLVIKEKQNYVSVYSPVKVYENGKYIITMTPERRFYNNNKEPFAEVSIHTKPQGDLYLILASYSKPENIIGIQAIFEPFIVWIWIGCAIMVLGGLHGIFPFKRK
ncbi:heme lyase CcmF/NrfE family subunit [Deferribacteraceae bacterium V6Fe1]|nr:heme lyase CcmF/NrfE family subunit [Deferribacteraceae bacterium V6Fe1]